MYREIILENFNRIHSTEMGIKRISKNLELDNCDIDVLKYCSKIIIDKESIIERIGKNYYIKNKDIVITLNAYSYTIITAHIK